MSVNEDKLRELEINAFLSQGELLGQLLSHPAWEGWKRLVTDMRMAALEELARCAEPGDFRFWQGAVAAYGEILDRPTRIVGVAAEYQRQEEDVEKTIRPDLRAAIGLGIDHDGDV